VILICVIKTRLESLWCSYCVLRRYFWRQWFSIKRFFTFFALQRRGLMKGTRRNALQLHHALMKSCTPRLVFVFANRSSKRNSNWIKEIQGNVEEADALEATYGGYISCWTRFWLLQKKPTTANSLHRNRRAKTTRLRKNPSLGAESHLALLDENC